MKLLVPPSGSRRTPADGEQRLGSVTGHHPGNGPLGRGGAPGAVSSWGQVLRGARAPQDGTAARSDSGPGFTQHTPIRTNHDPLPCIRTRLVWTLEPNGKHVGSDFSVVVPLLVRLFQAGPDQDQDQALSHFVLGPAGLSVVQMGQKKDLLI